MIKLETMNEFEEISHVLNHKKKDSTVILGS